MSSSTAPYLSELRGALRAKDDEYVKLLKRQAAEIDTLLVRRKPMHTCPDTRHMHPHMHEDTNEMMSWFDPGARHTSCRLPWVVN